MNYIGIFQGGGVKGIAHVGALKALEERGLTCVKAAGTSVGAIIASLVACGYKSDEMIYIIQNLHLPSLRIRSTPLKIIKELGFYSSKPLKRYLDYLYERKGISKYLDLKDGCDYSLKVIATDLTKRCQIVFPNDLPKYYVDPDHFKISTSVVMSSTYPLFYKPIKLNNHLVVDGSIVNNFPLDAFKNETNLPIIGFNLIGENMPKLKLNNCFIIPITLPKVKTMNFKINAEMKQSLYLAGYKAGKRFLRTFFS